MTNPQNQNDKLRTLFLQIDSIDIRKTGSIAVMQQQIEKLINYLSGFAAFIAAESQQLKERQLMQVHFADKLHDDSLRVHFLQDQHRYLKRWIEKFESVVFQYDDSCQVNLSSREMLYFVRLLRDAELLEKTELKYTFQFLSKHFYTAQQALLSAESLRKKYSKLDKDIIMKTGATLKKLNDLNKNYLLSATDSSE